MAKHGMMVTWARAIPGKANVAAELFQSWNGFWDKQKTTSTVERVTPVMIAHGDQGHLNGFFWIEGDIDKLQTMRWSDEFQDLFARTMHAVEGVGVYFAHANEGAAEFIQRWATNA